MQSVYYFGTCNILSIQNLSHKAVLKVFHFSNKVLAFRSNEPRFDPTSSALIFYHLVYKLGGSTDINASVDYMYAIHVRSSVLETSRQQLVVNCRGASPEEVLNTVERLIRSNFAYYQ